MPTAVPNLTLKILAVSCPLRQTLPPERSLRAAHRPGGNGMELASSDAAAVLFFLKEEKEKNGGANDLFEIYKEEISCLKECIRSRSGL